MQMDFHFYTVYALARCAGFAPDHARIVAYASQHTDDAEYDHALEFRNGGRFQQVLSAHRLADPDAVSKATCYQIWIPFHFLPGNSGPDFYQRMLTRPGSTVIQKLLDDLLFSKPKPFILQRLGVTLHVYADTWSHQNFLGVLNDKLNDVKDLEANDMPKTLVKKFIATLKKDTVEYLAPKLGHAQAGSFPDEPFREWRYRNWEEKTIEVSNIERSLDAAQASYIYLSKFLHAFPVYFSCKPVPWHMMAAGLRSLFLKEGDLDKRVESWKAAVSDGQPGFTAMNGDKDLVYDNREWFREAVSVEKAEKGPDLYERRDGFETSNWKYFHDAAALHKFTVLSEVLPECGMVCG